MANSVDPAWSDAKYCHIWSGSTLFAMAYLSQYLGLLWYVLQVDFRNITKQYMYIHRKTNKSLD